MRAHIRKAIRPVLGLTSPRPSYEQEKERLNPHPQSPIEGHNSQLVPSQWSPRRIISLLVTSLLLAMLGLRYSNNATKLRYERNHAISLPPKYLRLVIPGTTNRGNLCKTVISAAIVGYPTPKAVDWNFRHDADLQDSERARNIGHVRGVYTYLKGLRPVDDDDLVLISNQQTWFQLRASVLIERYFAISQLAETRLEGYLRDGKDNLTPITQRVLFSSEWPCTAKEPEDPTDWKRQLFCLTKDINVATDATAGSELSNTTLPSQQHFPWPGMIMGSVRDLRILYTRVLELVLDDNDNRTTSGQSVFYDIFAQQEFYRSTIAQNYSTNLERGVENVKTVLGLDDYRLSTALQERLLSEYGPITPSSNFTYDFGISIDYQSEILQPTASTFQDSAWLNFSDTAQVNDALARTGTPFTPTLPNDISTSKGPFDFLRRLPFPSGKLPRHFTWSHVPLFTNLRTSITPVAAYFDGPDTADRMHAQWNETWYHPYARTLMDARVIEPAGPIARALVRLDVNGTGSGTGIGIKRGEEMVGMREWWSYHFEYGVVDTDDPGDKGGIWFDRFCGGLWEELLRDGKGGWDDPRQGFD